jgi:hypothetical protein
MEVANSVSDSDPLGIIYAAQFGALMTRVITTAR